MRHLWGWVVLSSIMGLIAVGCHQNKPNDSQENAGSGKTVKAFKKISLLGAATIEWQSGKESTVQVDGDPEDVRKTTTVVVGDTLTISQGPNSHLHGKVVVKVVAPTLEEVTINGAGNFTASSLDLSKLGISVHGAGNFVLGGKVDKASFSIQGTGTIDARKLVAQDVIATISGAGDIQVHPIKTLEAEISGTGVIQYLGEPKITRQKVGMVGRLEKL